MSEPRLLTASEMQRLCDLHGDVGEGDLLDFIERIKRERGRWSVLIRSDEQLMSVIERMQEIE